MLVSLFSAVICFADGPPVEPGPFLKPDLVELTKLDPSIKLDIRYATKNNFLGRAVYPEARAFLQRPAADALARVNQSLKKEGLGLMIFDGYRPWAVTKIFWDETPVEKREFVADPAKGSRHNRGCAVDLTLYDLKTGQPLPMPSDYDEMNEKAHPDYAGGESKARTNRDKLRKAMEVEGFSIYPNEWWHFDFKGWEQYALMNLSFAEVAAMNQPPEKKADLGFTWPVPAGWKSETIPFPLEFAPDLKHKGVEEIRFMPGFFKPDAPDFWSYAFVWFLDGEDLGLVQLSPNVWLANELKYYFHGLCVAVGKETHYECAPDMFKARLKYSTNQSRSDNGIRMLGEIHSFDPFKTGKPITLQLQVRHLVCNTAKGHAILFAASPKPVSDPVWKELNTAMDSFRCESPM